MMRQYRSRRPAIAIVLTGAVALGLTACAAGSISEDRMVEIRQPLADTFRETMVGLGFELASDDQEFLTQSSWCTQLGDDAMEGGRQVLHQFYQSLQIDNTESLTGAEIEEIAADIFEDNGLTVETVVEDGPSSHRTTIEGRIFDDPNGESVGIIRVHYRGDPTDTARYIAVNAATECARGDDLIDLND